MKALGRVNTHLSDAMGRMLMVIERRLGIEARSDAERQMILRSQKITQEYLDGIDTLSGNNGRKFPVVPNPKV